MIFFLSHRCTFPGDLSFFSSSFSFSFLVPTCNRIRTSFFLLIALSCHWLRSYPFWGFTMKLYFTHLSHTPQKFHPLNCYLIPHFCGTRPWYIFSSSMFFSIGPGTIQVPMFLLSISQDGLRDGFFFSRTVHLGNMTVVILYPQNFQNWWTFIPKMNPSWFWVTPFGPITPF